VQPIKTRIDMLSTGVKTPVGIQISGDNLAQIETIGRELEGILANVPGTLSAYAERAQSGRYIEINTRRKDAAKYGLNIADIQLLVKHALGGATIAESVQGKERFPINLRYPRRYRDQIEELKALPFLSPTGAWVTLEQVADIEIKDGPALIKSENGRFIAWTFIDLQPDVVIGDYIAEAKDLIASELVLPKHSIRFSGQYEYMQRVNEKLSFLIPLTLLLIFVILYLAFHSSTQALLVIATLPVALAGSLWFIYLLEYPLSIAVIVGMIALAGVAAEFAVVMLIYLNQAVKNEASLLDAVKHGAVLRVRPKAMTVLTIIFGLLPIMIGSGTGSEVMQKIAAPMLGGMIISPLVSMLVIPCAYYLLYKHKR
jgi:Cu(I)/Ag(I) efflux system membrane protein CusA/SilA